jgi:hypothetical protein
MFRTSLYCLVMLLYPCFSFAQCPPPVYTSNQICLDPDGGMPIQDIGGGVRQRVFSLNGRTMDDRQPNIFWIVNGEWSIGNVADPKFIFKQYPYGKWWPQPWADPLPANTTKTFTFSSSYGTQHGSFHPWAAYLDANKKVIPVPRHFGIDWQADLGQCWAHPGYTSEEFLFGDYLLDKIEYVIMYGRAENGDSWDTCR